MKKITILILALVTSLGGFSQTYTLSNKNNNLGGSAGDDHFESLVTLTNTSAVSTRFTWVKLGVALQNGWTVQLCDPVTCFDSVPDSNNFILKAGKSAIFSFKVTPNGKGGTGKVSIGLSPNGNNGPFDTINFAVNSWSLGVTNNQARMAEFSVFPNPCQNELNIHFDSKYTYQIEVLNIIGNRVKNFTNLEGNSKLDISDLADGVYIVRLNDRGKILTRRITKS